MGSRPVTSEGDLLGIGEAAARTGVSERALRYWQQLGLITPTGTTPGGLRRYSEADTARVGRLRELQELLGFGLEEIREVFDNEDRLERLRAEYHAEQTDAARRRELIAEGLEVRAGLRAAVAAKIEALQAFADRLDTERARLQRILDEGVPGEAQPTGSSR
jgi:DNA-binding transcriptional MerR regulator